MSTANNDNIIKTRYPLVSIVVPIYNVDLAYFDKCMETLLNQTIHDIEIVLVDDGSELNCAKWCDAYAVKDPRVRVIHQRNQGVSAARNRGIKETKAEWILFVDADDWLELKTVEKIKKNIEDATYDIVFFDHQKEYAGRNESVHFKLEPGIYDTSNVELKELLFLEAMGPKSNQYGNITYSWGKVYNKKFLIDNGLEFPVGMPKSEDKVFILRCIYMLKKLLKTDDCLYHYRINALSVCNKYTESADTDRAKLIHLLMEIASSMDEELSHQKGIPSYNKVTKKCELFSFGIITDILKLKYFHKDYPRSDKERDKEVKVFLKSEPYKQIISDIGYSELSFEAKLKKFLILHNMAGVFYNIKHLKQVLHRRVAE